ncbi:unnamed protein product, partial [Brenthis ino]
MLILAKFLYSFNIHIYFRVSSNNNDVLISITARDVSIVTAGPRGNLSAPARPLLLMSRPPCPAQWQERRRHNQLSIKDYRTRRHIR